MSSDQPKTLRQSVYVDKVATHADGVSTYTMTGIVHVDKVTTYADKAATYAWLKMRDVRGGRPVARGRNCHFCTAAME